MTELPIIYGGVEMYSIRDSISISWAGGSEMEFTNSGRRIGQRSLSRIGQITAELWPAVDTQSEADLLTRFLATPGFVPIIVPGVGALAVRSIAPQTSGYFTSNTATWNATWLIDQSVQMSDALWRGPFPGRWAYTKSMVMLNWGSWASQPNIGFRATGTGVWSGTMLCEQVGQYDPFVAQPTLVTDISLENGAHVALGLANSPVARLNQPFANMGIGVVWDNNILSIMTQTGQVHRSMNVNTLAGRYRVLITYRPLYSRVEVWRGEFQLMCASNVPTPVIATQKAVLNVRTGSATLHQWWVTGN